MNDDQIDDLKQFVAATVSQSEARIEEKLGGKIDGLEAKLEARIDQLEKKMDDGFAGVGDTIAVMQDQLDNHETRLTKLETSPTT